MNIGVFTDCYPPTKNGVSTAIVQAVQELEYRGHKVVVFTVACPGATGRDPSVYRFPSLPFNPQIEIRLGLARQGAIDRIVAREQLDIIHTHTEFSLGWAGKRAARRAGLPAVHTLHTLYPAYRHYLPLGRLLPERTIGRLLAWILTGYDVVVCPSEKGRAYVASCVPEMPTAVIGNGVSREGFNLERVTEDDRDRARAALGIDPAERVVLFVGRLAQEKRVLALLAALQPLLAADAGCRAVFVGTGPCAGRPGGRSTRGRPRPAGAAHGSGRLGADGRDLRDRPRVRHRLTQRGAPDDAHRGGHVRPAHRGAARPQLPRPGA